MNYKTTIALVVMVAAFGLAYLGLGGPPSPSPAADADALTNTPGVERSLLADDALGDVVRIACRSAGQGAEWVFQKSADDDAWRIVKPFEAGAVAYKVDRIHRQLTALKYEIAYRIGEPGAVDAAAAGLDPPTATVTLGDADGGSATIEIGKSAGRDTTYVRLAGTEEVVIGKSKLTDLLANSALEYRDQQLFDFKPEDVERLEFVDRTMDPDNARTYVLARDGDDWVFEAPVSGPATDEVNQALRALSNARVSTWYESQVGQLASFGLQTPALTIRATGEREVAGGEEAKDPETPEEGEDEAPSAPETETFDVTLHVSKVSPLGKDTFLYARKGDEDAVGSIAKTTTDKLKPVESKWRDLRLVRTDVLGADKIRLKSSGPAIDLVRRGSEWWIDSEPPIKAESDPVQQLLTSIQELKSRELVPFQEGDEAAFGLDSPQARIRLNIPGQDEPERIVVGKVTDEQLKRMVYVRRNESQSVAKVRIDETANLTRSSGEYRDRTIFDLAGGTLQRIEVTRRASEDGGAENTVAFAPRTDDPNAWHMVAPVESELRDTFDAFVQAMSRLSGDRYVGSDPEQRSKYGLDTPSTTMSLTVLPAPATRLEPKAEGDESEETNEENQLVPVEFQPPAITVLIDVADSGRKFYAMRRDTGDMFQIGKDLHERLVAEYHDDAVFTFEASQVSAFSIRHEDDSHAFHRQGGTWVYDPEPGLPLDQESVENLLVQLGDLKSVRFLEYDADLADYGLESPAHDASVTVDGGTRHRLRISAMDHPEGLLATADDGPNVFLLSGDSLDRIRVSIQDLEAD